MLRRGIPWRPAAWALAWCAWAWMGWLLYRHLPRTFGEPIATLPLADAEFMLSVDEPAGVAYSYQDAAIDPNGNALPGPSRLRVWDARAGRLRGSFDVPRRRRFPPLWQSLPITHGKFVAESRPDADPKLPQSPAVLDLQTGEWRTLAGCVDAASEDPVIASDQPWAAFAARLPTDERMVDGVVVPWRWFLFDVLSGTPLGMLPALDAGETVRFWGFLPGADRLLALRESMKDGSREAQIWRIPLGIEPEFRFPISPHMWASDLAAFSSGQRVCFTSGYVEHQGRPQQSIDALDLRTGATLLAHPPLAERRPIGATFGIWQNPCPHLSRDGATAVCRSSRSVWDVDSGRRIGTLPAGVVEIDDDIVVTCDDASKHPFVLGWNRWVGRVVPGLKLEPTPAYSVRDLRTGAVHFRCDRQPSPAARRGQDSIVIGHSSSVYAGPPRVRWGWLAAAQTLLATPMAACWLFLRWRASRAARAATGFPPR